MRATLSSAVLVLIASTGIPLSAQQPTADAASSGVRATQPFRAGVDLVALTVTVTDKEDQYLSDLDAEDFRVFEDGIGQPVTFFARADVPLDLLLLVDGSASMSAPLPLVHAATRGLLQTLRPGDRASVVEFRDSVRVIQAMTDDLEAARRAAATTGAFGGTSLYNALYVAIKNRQAEAPRNADVRRQAIVVLSDGQDTGSLIDFEDLMDLARRAGISVYTVSMKSSLQQRIAKYQPRRHFDQSEYSMKALAQETGGRAYFPAAPADLDAIYQAVGRDLASQYTLGYVSRNPVRNGEFRRLVVKVVDPPTAQPRTRSGYFAGTDRPLALREVRSSSQ